MLSRAALEPFFSQTSAVAPPLQFNKSILDVGEKPFREGTVETNLSSNQVWEYDVDGEISKDDNLSENPDRLLNIDE